MFVCVSVYLGYLLERAYHTHRDRQPHYHDGIVQIRKRFLCSETPFNWLMAHQVFVNMHWGPMPVLCVGLSLWSGRVNNADRHLSGAKGARRPTLKCPNSSCQWLWQGESGAVRCSVSAQLVSPSQVRQVCVSKRTLARLRWPACVYVSGRSCSDVAPLVTDVTWSALPLGNHIFVYDSFGSVETRVSMHFQIR